ncbi:Uncharacterised protein [Halioglobus japonicus]|nr:Uncharacterised protein [Halioglobus japonicus]
MNNSIKLALFGLALSSSVSFAQDCTAPATPTLPDGSTATLEQMLAGQQAVKDFQADNTAYRTCLEPHIAAAESAASGDSPGQELVEALKVLTDDYNASVSKEEALATDFNTELREYKEANPS